MTRTSTEAVNQTYQYTPAPRAGPRHGAKGWAGYIRMLKPSSSETLKMDS